MGANGDLGDAFGFPFRFQHVRLCFARCGGYALSSLPHQADLPTNIEFHSAHTLDLDPAAVIEEMIAKMIMFETET